MIPEFIRNAPDQLKQLLRAIGEGFEVRNERGADMFSNVGTLGYVYFPLFV
jgi:hypothetical protein